MATCPPYNARKRQAGYDDGPPNRAHKVRLYPYPPLYRSDQAEAGLLDQSSALLLGYRDPLVVPSVAELGGGGYGLGLLRDRDPVEAAQGGRCSKRPRLDPGVVAPAPAQGRSAAVGVGREGDGQQQRRGHVRPWDAWAKRAGAVSGSDGGRGPGSAASPCSSLATDETAPSRPAFSPPIDGATWTARRGPGTPPAPSSTAGPEEVVCPESQADLACPSLAGAETGGCRTGKSRHPFPTVKLRHETAEVRKTGCCIRCRMNKIRCVINPADRTGSCLTCASLRKPRIQQPPCMRIKLTEIKLYKPGQVKGYEWTKRWAEGATMTSGKITQWASSEIRLVTVTEGIGAQPVQLRVRRFVPQEGDSLERSWMHQGVERRVRVPPFAILDMAEAREAYARSIREGIRQCCRCLLPRKPSFIPWHYATALKLAEDGGTDEPERVLLRNALELWMSVRITTQSTFIVGDETLDMPRNIMDETSSLHGHIPLPPVLGAQIDLMLIHQFQESLRRDVLKRLQETMRRKKHRTWLVMYLVTFILLHNVSLLCQYDAEYARKHGIQARFAREFHVWEYQQGANVLLTYFHHGTMGRYPFTKKCKETELNEVARGDWKLLRFVCHTGSVAETKEDEWARIRRNGDCGNDYFFVSQLYVQDWRAG